MDLSAFQPLFYMSSTRLISSTVNVAGQLLAARTLFLFGHFKTY